MAFYTWNLEDVRQAVRLYQLAQHRCSKCIHWDWEKGCHKPNAVHNFPVQDCYCFEPVAPTPSYSLTVQPPGTQA